MAGKQRDLFRFVTHFWERVQRGQPHDCWPWTGATDHGYGDLGWCDPETGQKHSLAAHRVAYHLVNGAPPYDMCVMHTCDNPTCCNPSHLKVGTVADNNRDRSLKGRTARPGVGKWRKPSPHSLPGEQHPMAKLTEDKVRQIRGLCAEGRLTQREIATLFGVSQGAVMAVKTRRHWKHVA